MALVFKTPKTAINTTTRDIQNIKDGECPPCPECPEVELTTAEVEYTDNGSFTVTPESGFDGLSQVDITVNIDTQAIEDAAYAEGEAAGIVTGKAQGVAEQKAKLTSTTLTTNGTVTREDGWNEVTVDVDTTTPYNEGVAAGIAEQKAKLTSLNVTANGTYNKEDGYNAVTVDVQPELEAKTVSYASNGEYTITPTTGKDGISEATITVDVPSDVNNQDKTVTPTTSSQSVTADSGYSGLGTVTVEAVTSSIDANIAAGNIKKDVSILGVTGSYDPQPTLQAKTATPTTSQQVITADSGNDGLSQVTVEGVTSAIDSNITANNIKSGVTILGVTGTVTEGITPTGNINITNTNSTDVTNYATAQVVDANLTAGNIKSGTTILGIQGSYDPQPDLETKSVTYTANDTYTITPTAGKDGMSSVEVTVNVAGGGGTQCPDWSSIGWDCNDVNNSELADVVAYTAQQKTAFENRVITTFNNDNKLLFAPNVDVNTYGLFKNCTNLRFTPSFDLVSSTNLTEMFYKCTSLEKVPLFDTSNVVNMSGMFDMFTNPGNTLLTQLPLFNTSNVTNMDEAFAGLKALQAIPLFDTSEVTSMEGTFANCFAITSVPQLDTSSNTSFNSTFHRCFGLQTVPLLDAHLVTNLNSMFGACSKLTNLGGLTNLGKAFTGSNQYGHLLDLSVSSVLTKESIMNVINNLAAPDNTAVTDATLKLSAASYALLTAEDIAIATAKNWSVTSA